MNGFSKIRNWLTQIIIRFIACHFLLYSPKCPFPSPYSTLPESLRHPKIPHDIPSIWLAVVKEDLRFYAMPAQILQMPYDTAVVEEEKWEEGETIWRARRSRRIRRRGSF